MALFPPVRRVPPIGLCLLFAAVLLLVGSVGPWADRAAEPSVSGTGHADGWLTLVAAVLAGLVVLGASRAGWRSRRPGIVIAVLAVLAAALIVVDLIDVTDYGSPMQVAALVDPGWGIYLALLGAVALGAGGLLAAAWPPGRSVAEPAVAPETSPS
jgi:hypothetical protein